MSDICFVSYHSLIHFSPFQAGKPLPKEIFSSAEPRCGRQLSYTRTMLEYVSLELDSLKGL